MFKQALIVASAAAATVAIPSAAHAQYGYGYYPPSNQGGYYGNPYGDRYYDSRYHDDRYYRRGSGCIGKTTGTVVGGAAGALIGREVAKGRRDYYGYRRGGDRTAGAIIGGALGALAGREIAKQSCRGR